MAVRIVQSMPFSSGCAFREQFYSTQHVSDNGGIVVASTIDRGVSPTGTSGRITYNGTGALLANWTKATFMFRFRTGAVTVGSVLFAKEPTALNDNCIIVQLYSAGGTRLGINVARTIADTGMYAYYLISTGVEYVAHLVFDGDLAGTARFALYLNAIPALMAFVNVPPAALLWNAAVPLTVFNMHGGTTEAPATDTVLRELRIHRKAFTQGEVLDDYNRTTYLGLP